MVCWQDRYYKMPAGDWECIGMELVTGGWREESGIMKLSDISNGPDWVIWAGFIILAAISAILLSGHGGWLIAGYNMASAQEKEKYNEKKLCRTTGAGMAVIAALILFMGIFEERLPAAFAVVAFWIIAADCLVIIILSHTICRKQK